MQTSTEIANFVFTGKASLIHRPALAHLCEMARNAPEGMCIEIGVYRGSSLAALAIARKGMGKIIGVDDWSYPDPPNLHDRALDTLNFFGVTVELMSMTSEEAARIVDGPFAFIHIDADHTLKAARQDIALWTPKLMSGGVIAFHDYGRSRDDIQVKQAVDEWQAREPWHLLGEVMTTIGYRKP